MAVATNDRHARLGNAKFRPDHMHDSLEWMAQVRIIQHDVLHNCQPAFEPVFLTIHL